MSVEHDRVRGLLAAGRYADARLGAEALLAADPADPVARVLLDRAAREDRSPASEQGLGNPFENVRRFWTGFAEGPTARPAPVTKRAAVVAVLALCVLALVGLLVRALG